MSGCRCCSHRITLVAYEATAFIVNHAPEGWLRRARLIFTALQRHFLSLAMIGITAWMGVSLLATFVDLSRDATRAFAWAALLVLSPPILSHNFLIFTEILSGFIALRVLLWLRGLPASRGAALLAGGTLGYLLLVHVRNAGLVAGLLGIAVYRSSRWPNGRAMLAWLTAGAWAMFLARTLLTYDFWGTRLTTAHARFETATGWLPFMGEALTRLAGWLFDHGLARPQPARVARLLDARGEVPGAGRAVAGDRRLCSRRACVPAASCHAGAGAGVNWDRRDSLAAAGSVME